LARSWSPVRDGFRVLFSTRSWRTGTGQLTVLVRKRANRQIAHCDACTGRKDRVLDPAALLSALPAALLAPAGHERLLSLAADPGPPASFVPRG